MKRTDAASIVLLALCLACLLVRLSSVPALSLDEAWIGMMAERLHRLGAYTPHEMNRYTGALYAWLVSACFSVRSVSLEALRLPGALLNCAALIGLWLHLRRRVSSEAAMSWALLCASSAYFLMKSRLAWEVYALHPVLILGTVIVLARPGGTAVLVALTMLGVQNHFIYLTIPASLVVLFGARLAWRDEQEAADKLSACAAALAAGSALALIKYPLSDALWMAHRPSLVAALTLIPIAAATAVRRIPASVLVLPFARARRQLTALFTLTTAAFIIWHLVPLIQVFAGPVVLMRLFSYEMPALLSAPLYAWGIFLAGLLAWNSVRAWHDDHLNFHERTLLLWPAAYAALFILMRHTNSLRYYSLPALLSMLALSVALTRLTRTDKRGVYRCALAVVILTQIFLLQELAAPGDRRPLTFHIGWRRENSKDFARKDGLFAAFEASRACTIAHAERSFTAIPLFFYRATSPVHDCDGTLAFDSDQCPECATAPYYRWTVVPTEK